jgi:hypothetical protein
MKEIEMNCLIGLVIVMIVPAIIGVWGSLERRPEPPAQVINLVPLEGSRELGEAIMKYASRAEQRSVGRQIGADIMLVLPKNFSREKLEYDAALNYDYLVEYGAYQGVTMRMAK